MRRTSAALLVAITLTGCGTAAATGSGSAGVVAPSASTRTITGYDLYTHCGIREAKIGDDYYVATPELSDGSGNPPAGWGNPYQSGTMTVRPDGTAQFTDAAGHEATFARRPGATTWIRLCM